MLRISIIFLESYRSKSFPQQINFAVISCQVSWIQQIKFFRFSPRCNFWIFFNYPSHQHHTSVGGVFLLGGGGFFQPSEHKIRKGFITSKDLQLRKYEPIRWKWWAKTFPCKTPAVSSMPALISIFKRRMHTKCILLLGWRFKK